MVTQITWLLTQRKWTVILRVIYLNQIGDAQHIISVSVNRYLAYIGKF